MTIRTGVPGEFKGTLIQIDDGLYLCTGRNVILALDPDSGEERWRYDPEIQSARIGFWDTCRGVTYYASPPEQVDSNCRNELYGHNGRKADCGEQETGETAQISAIRERSICLQAWGKSSSVTTL